jgi:hypothetical protein
MTQNASASTQRYRARIIEQLQDVICGLLQAEYFWHDLSAVCGIQIYRKFGSLSY